MNQPLEIGREIGGLYLVDHKLRTSSLAGSSTLSSPFVNKTASSYYMTPLEVWHCHLGHISFTNMKHIDVVSSCKALPQSICQFCHYAK